jgi:hypothetical protein
MRWSKSKMRSKTSTTAAELTATGHVGSLAQRWSVGRYAGVDGVLA